MGPPRGRNRAVAVPVVVGAAVVLVRAPRGIGVGDGERVLVDVVAGGW
ncbi:MAG TPA: hypothetical protein VNT51_12350 [Miltoncostaeaceae bacterium]|nr:hypothetical protein [Miltoncostaeaceae bacterium]